MKNLQTLISSEKKYMFNILDSIKVEIDGVKNPYDIPINDLFTMAARINKKRSFLFVSKVLGKHLPIEPEKALAIAALLGVRYLESVDGLEFKKRKDFLSLLFDGGSYDSLPFIPEKINPLIIGFAETATALGHGFFDCFQRAEYFHTTREDINGQAPVITFEEEHSHATSHRCYIPIEMISHKREIILIDDELTTGKTALNIIKSIHAAFPRQVYTVVSILDWRSEEDQQRFLRLEQDLGIKINVVSLIAGKVNIHSINEIESLTKITGTSNQKASIEVVQLDSFFTASTYVSKDQLLGVPFIKETGRFGLSSSENVAVQGKITSAGHFLRQKREGKRTLCIGTGEFMYLPMKLAAEMGSEVYYQSTTRSPIHIQNVDGYGARFGVTFPNPEDEKITHFVYNIPPSHYDELFVFMEREVSYIQLQPMLEELKKLGFQTIKIVFCSGY
ncbi:phosphoribosyltransferase family protein [Bacillus sp. USDA818B3_A]|uniref:phosphoribosyltransferase family protein n=1 Tax=Bacillus sp. USDA818B3_A TaxID=2698834 RepID=UPI001920637E|nr:phosphoribosyltransferase family protein [Bacillus sp. USDA818B3_A]